MVHHYGERYLEIDSFINYCRDLKLTVDTRELEHYEETGVMLPVARVIYPEDYVVYDAQQMWGRMDSSVSTTRQRWPGLDRLSDRLRVTPESWANLSDEELIDPFDREIGTNPFLTRPDIGTFKPWDSYLVAVPYEQGQTLKRPSAVHYYSYWQVHQLDYIQKYPDLYKNKALLDCIPKDIKMSIFRPWSPNPKVLRDFHGMGRFFDALSFWLTMYSRERSRTFAVVAEQDYVQRLDSHQAQSYEERLMKEAKVVQTRFGLTSDSLYGFLFDLIEFHDDYEREEHHKLAVELENDISALAQLIELAEGDTWDTVASKLGHRNYWTAKSFRHMDVATKERDDAQDFLLHIAKQYGENLDKLGITNHTTMFADGDVDDLLNYCQRQGLSVLQTALSGMVASEEEYATKFRRVARYSNLKNALSSIEYLMKSVAAGHINFGRATLTPLVENIMSGEPWVAAFTSRRLLTGGSNSTDFYNNLQTLLQDRALTTSEDCYWARVFLFACLARNLTIHFDPNDDWYYGELFGEMLSAAVLATLYTWQFARRCGWA
ncbi:MAG: hypothetical protein Q7K03_06225 [Dehalococcoidia bacterium]|nr:hypothetical protein [Dehalococcoidia bacterium]